MKQGFQGMDQLVVQLFDRVNEMPENAPTTSPACAPASTTSTA